MHLRSAVQDSQTNWLKNNVALANNFHMLFLEGEYIDRADCSCARFRRVTAPNSGELTNRSLGRIRSNLPYNRYRPLAAKRYAGYEVPLRDAKQPFIRLQFPE